MLFSRVFFARGLSSILPPCARFVSGSFSAAISFFSSSVRDSKLIFSDTAFGTEAFPFSRAIRICSVPT